MTHSDNHYFSYMEFWWTLRFDKLYHCCMLMWLLWSSFFWQCGYGMANTEIIPHGYKKIYVPQVVDAGLDVGAAAALTRYLRSRIELSHIADHTNLKDAEVVLEAKIHSISDVINVAPNPGNRTLAQTYAVPKYTLTMYGSMRMIDADGRVVWQSGVISAGEDYLTALDDSRDKMTREGALPYTESHRRRAIERAAAQLADELYSRLTEGF